MFAILAGSSRDFWDWMSLSLGIAAALAAVAAFVPWALAHRRRPELRVFWQYSNDPSSAPTAWPDEMPTLEVGRPVLVTVTTRNVGDAVAENLAWNFSAPSALTLSRPHAEGKPPESNSSIAGQAPDYAVTYFFHAEDTLSPGDFTSQAYQLELRSNVRPRDAQLRLLLEVSQARLNSAGQRIVPSLVLADNDDLGPELGGGTPWPPPRQKRVIRRVAAKPKGQLQCKAGSRSDVRDVLIKRDDQT